MRVPPRPLRLVAVRRVPPGPEAEVRLRQMWEWLLAKDEPLSLGEASRVHDTPRPGDDDESGPLPPG
jgi:hypothetical protein